MTIERTIITKEKVEIEMPYYCKTATAFFKIESPKVQIKVATGLGTESGIVRDDIVYILGIQHEQSTEAEFEQAYQDALQTIANKFQTDALKVS